MLAPTYLLGTLRPPRPFPSAQAPTPPKSRTLPHSGEAYYARPHLPPRYPPPSAIPSTPPYTILYIEGPPYPITEYPLYIME
jgi:hypothetical protein